MQLAQFYPDRITITTHKPKSINDVYSHWLGVNSKSKSLENLKKKKNSFELSVNSKRNLKASFINLFYHSKPRTIKIGSKKFIYNYRSSFITLTLPSKQMHSDVVIKGRLNVFLQLLRDKYDVKNYVWKAELQSNKNIHFHLFTDKFVNYMALLYYWNKCLKPLGYIDEYQKKFADLSLSSYIALRSEGCPIKSRQNFNSYSMAYANGKKTNWRSPNSVDVKSVQNAKSLGFYIAKYITKDVSKKSIVAENDDTLLRLSTFGKVWARSKSLSGLKYINKIDYEEIKQAIMKLKVKSGACKDVIFDYCRVVYLYLERCPKWFVALHRTIMTSLARLNNYPFPT
ncbi:hypothetical protein CVT91_09380 [Candidatus Atribacteria bacterium HGW-Atribacteria-1]|nr:MAG: hypothetical protein CVT91_09380 [Candidatus Atribacteria bacterium HGW-Atribacteria-1]